MEESQITLKSHTFELAYERTCHQVDLICNAERLRKLRVRVVLSEERQDDLNAQIIQHNDRIDELEELNGQFQEELEVCTSDLESAQVQLRVKSRETETLKVLANASKNSPVMQS